MRIMVSVGTHEQPFQRLLDAVSSAMTARPEDEWVVQYGVGTWPDRSPAIHAAPYLDADAMCSWLEWADVLVSQSSPGNVFGALAAGTWPLVLGRSRGAGEHVDDHQIRFAASLETMGYATDVRRPERLQQVLRDEAARSRDDRAASIARATSMTAQHQAAFRNDVWSALGAST